jgi:hypothetical protein
VVARNEARMNQPATNTPAGAEIRKCVPRPRFRSGRTLVPNLQTSNRAAPDSEQPIYECGRRLGAAILINGLSHKE